MLSRFRIRIVWNSSAGDALRAVFLGVVATALTHGFVVLDGTNIGWLGDGDTAAGFLGWAFYRNDPWSKDVFAVPSYGLELSSSVPYTGTIPLLAVLFKLLSPALPSFFQFYGFWVLLIFSLQAFFAQRLLAVVSAGIALRSLGAGFFVMAPPLIHRATIDHAVLLSHFIFLLALWLYFGKVVRTRLWVWPLTMGLAILLFPYYPFMLLPIWVADVWRRYSAGIRVRALSAEVAATVSLLALLAWLLGLFDGGARGGGYGKFKMNFLSIIDSDGWSFVLPDIPNAHPYEFEGFNFLGSGLIGLGVIAILLAFRNRVFVLNALSQHSILLVGLSALAIFSYSNVVGIGPLKIEIPIPPLAKELGDVIRATGRFFWPVFYFIVFATLIMAIRFLGRRVAIVVLSLTILIQVIDTAPGWLPYREEIHKSSGSTWQTAFEDPQWQELASRHTKLRTLPASSHYLWRDVGYLALKNNLDVDGVYLARIGTRGKTESEIERERLFATGELDDGAFYIVEPSFWEERKTEISGINAKHLIIDGVLVLVSQ